MDKDYQPRFSLSVEAPHITAGPYRRPTVFYLDSLSANISSPAGKSSKKSRSNGADMPLSLIQR